MAKILSAEAIAEVLSHHDEYGEDIEFSDADGRVYEQPTCACGYPLGKHLSLTQHQAQQVVDFIWENTTVQSGALIPRFGGAHPGLWGDFIQRGEGEPMVRLITNWEKDNRDPSQRQRTEDHTFIDMDDTETGEGE